MTQESPKQAMRRREFFQKSLAAGSLLLAPSLIGACSTSTSTSTSATASGASTSIKRGGKLRVGFVGGGDLETLDPQSALNDVDFGRGLNLYDRITHFMPDMSVENLLAESFEPNSTGTAWQLKLKSGVTFHNGKPLTANDALFSFQRIVTKKLTGASRLTAVDWKNAKVTGTLTLLLPMLQPWIDLPAMFAEVYDSILPEGTTNFKHPIGTGPFKFVEWHQGQQSLFVKNPDYFISGKPYVDELSCVSIPDNTSRLQALQSGQIDAMAQIDFAQAKSLANSSTIKLVVAKTDYNVPIYMRMDQEPFTDNRVREAMRLLADRPQLVADCFFDYGTIANDLFGKGVPYYDGSLPQRVYDPEKAKSLLKQAGRPGRADLELVHVNGGTRHARVCDRLRAAGEGRWRDHQACSDAGVDILRSPVLPEGSLWPKQLAGHHPNHVVLLVHQNGAVQRNGLEQPWLGQGFLSGRGHAGPCQAPADLP